MGEMTSWVCLKIIQEKRGSGWEYTIGTAGVDD